MKPLFTFLSLFILLSFSFAQTTFQMAYGGANLDKCNDVTNTPDGGYIIAGESKNSDGDQSIILTKTNAQGHITWSKMYMNGVFEMPNSVLNAPNGGYVVAGERYPAVGPSELAYIFQVDKNGVLQWQRIFDSGGNMAEALAAKNTKDGGYIIGGRAERTIVATNIFLNMSSEIRYLYLLKINGQGDPVWSKKYNTGEQIRMTRANDVFSCDDGGFIVAGEFQHNTVRKDLDMGLVKVDKLGAIVWAKQFGGSKMDAGTEVVQTQDGGFVLGGETESFGAGKLDICLVKTDKNGRKLWSRTYGNAGYDQIGSICELDNGNLVVVGKTSGTSNENVQVLILVVDKNGNVVSTNAYGGAGMDNAVSVRPNGSGIIVGANTMSLGMGGMDMMILKHDLSTATNCNATADKIYSAVFTPKISDMTSRVITESIDESSSKKFMGKGSTKVEKAKIASKVLCK